MSNPLFSRGFVVLLLIFTNNIFCVIGDGNTTTVDPVVELNVWIITAFQNTSVGIACHLDDLSVPVIWSKVDGELPEGSNATARTFLIASVQPTHAGFYECRPAHLAASEGAQTVTEVLVFPDPSLVKDSNHTKKVLFHKKAANGTTSDLSL